MELRNSFEGLEIKVDNERTRSFKRRNSRNRRRKTGYNYDRNSLEDNVYKDEKDNRLENHDSDSIKKNCSNPDLKYNSYERETIVDLNNDDQSFETVVFRKSHRRHSIRDIEKSLVNNFINNDNLSYNDTIFKDKIQIVDNPFNKEFNFSSDLQDEKHKSIIEYDGRMSNPPTVQVFNETSEETKDDLKTADYSIQNKAGLYNTRYLTKSSSTYEVEKFNRNAMVIFNQVNVNGYKPRKGTEKDVEALTETFSTLGFEINTHDDYNKVDIFSTLDEFSNSDFTDYGCLAIVVLTHGSDGGYLRAKDISYHESELLNYFKTANKPTLTTKPKIFIIQACRGTKVTTATFAGRAAAGIQLDAAKQIDHYTLPTESDILFLHSTYAGNAAHREELNGSWFIQSLCKHIKKLAATTDLESIVTEALKDVAINKEHEVYNRVTGVVDINKQMPVKTSTLIRKLYLKKQNFETDIDGSRSSSHSDICKTTNLLCDSGNGGMDDYYKMYIFANQHFMYLKNVLKQFVEDNQGESLGQALYNIADSIDVDEVSISIRDSVAKEISNYLKNHARQWSGYGMIFLWIE